MRDYCHQFRLQHVLCIVLLLLLSTLLTACKKAVSELQLSGQTMGTSYGIRVVTAVSAAEKKALKAAVDRRLIEINKQMSTYQVDSELSRFNVSPDKQWFPVSTELLQLVLQAKELHELSGGAFDISVGPLVNLWGFGPTTSAVDVPTPAMIVTAMKRVGQTHLKIRQTPPALYKDVALYLDLSAIAKGYAVDQVAQLLKHAGWSNWLVEIGGEIRVSGNNASGLPWQIGIERPDEHNIGIVQRVFGLADGAVATSGNYRNFFIYQGVRYSHIIDARNGWPVSHQLALVTVLAETAAHADGLATLLYILGAEKGFELAQKLGWAALFVIQADKGYLEKATAGFQARNPG